MYFVDQVDLWGYSLSHKSFRFRFGYNEDEDQAKKGLLRVRPSVCAFSNCHAPKFNFGACQLNSLVGRAAAVE
jgi:hypothetical protein